MIQSDSKYFSKVTYFHLGKGNIVIYLHTQTIWPKFFRVERAYTIDKIFYLLSAEVAWQIEIVSYLAKQKTFFVLMFIVHPVLK